MMDPCSAAFVTSCDLLISVSNSSSFKVKPNLSARSSRQALMSACRLFREDIEHAQPCSPASTCGRDAGAAVDAVLGLDVVLDTTVQLIMIAEEGSMQGVLGSSCVTQAGDEVALGTKSGMSTPSPRSPPATVSAASSATVSHATVVRGP